MSGPGKRGRDPAGDVLGVRALNRALLARQMLLHRVKRPAATALEHLLGLQSQIPTTPYVALWTRLDGFQPGELSRRIEDRQVVRIALMRSTIHSVTAADALALRPVVQPVLARGFQGNYGKRLAGVDLEAVAATGRALVEEQPRTFQTLGVLLRERWPDRDPNALAMAVRCLVPLVQIPPRGLWGGSGQATHTSAEAWLGRPLASETAPDEMILRYLAAFGPATVKDVQTWSGLTHLRAAVERLRPRLCAFRDKNGHELLDLPEAPRPGPDTLAPTRFLPDYDNVLLAHADRTRILTDAHRPLISTLNGLRPTVLVDGFVHGAWKITREKTTATLKIEIFEKLSKRDRTALADEGVRLLDLTDGECARRVVEFTAAE